MKESEEYRARQLSMVRDYLGKSNNAEPKSAPVGGPASHSGTPGVAEKPPTVS
jgi:hypothetical protein